MCPVKLGRLVNIKAVREERRQRIEIQICSKENYIYFDDVVGVMRYVVARPHSAATIV